VLYSSGAVVDAGAGSPDDGGRPSGPGRSGKARTGKKKRKRAKAPLWTKLLIIFGVILALGSGLTIGGVKLTLAEATKSIDRENLLGAEGGAAKHVSINGAQNILLMGLDNRPGQNPTDLVRSDSIIIVHIPANHDAAYLVSIPRDLWVHIPAFPKTHFAGQDEKINAAFAFGNAKGGGYAGGVELLAKTINQYWGITFNAAAIVDFQGFQQVVNVLGGVDMYVDEETTSVHIGFDKNGNEKMPYRINADTGKVIGPVPGVTPVVYHVGQQHLAPWQALDYVRQRELLKNGDYDRERHQQQFIKAIFKEILSKNVLFDLGKLQKVMDVVGKAMTVDTGGISVQDWAFAMKGISANSMVTIKTNNGTFHSDAAGRETLDANTIALLSAVKADTVGDFVGAHPELVTNS
jgi:polyisoprenyl-teichoic acid--peptidoglycan teichoic acid transferase